LKSSSSKLKAYEILFRVRIIFVTTWHVREHISIQAIASQSCLHFL